VLPQQVVPLAAQNGVDPVEQHTWVELQEVFPQQVVPPLAQNGLDPVVQQVWVELQPEVSPQQVFPLLTQKVCPPYLQGTPPSRQRPKASGATCALASRLPSVPRRPPASAPASSFNACRRGVGPARMRAASSRKLAVLSGTCDITHLLCIAGAPVYICNRGRVLQMLRIYLSMLIR